MGTRSTIGIVNPNGAVTGIYCHWDGYPEYNGQILRDHYTDPSKIRKLLKLGDLSSLGPELGKKHKFDGESIPEWCTAYGRDRGEEGTEATLYSNVEEFFADDRGQDYAYLFVNDKWECRDVYNGQTVDLYAMIDKVA